MDDEIDVLYDAIQKTGIKFTFLYVAVVRVGGQRAIKMMDESKGSGR